MEKSIVDMDKVWRSYSKSKDAALKEKIILHYAPLVKFVAGRLSVHIGAHVEYDDMISYGIFGLIDAIDKFDCEKGVKFETYASLRIRGSIIDSLRKLDWVPRTLRQKNKKMEQACVELETLNGREPTVNELAEKLDVTIDEIINLQKKSSIISLVSLDDYLDQTYDGGFGKAEFDEDNPEQRVDKKETTAMLVDVISKLNDKEKKVVTLYYFEELTLKEISIIMGVSESRISQIHSKAIGRLKVKLGKYKSILFV